VRITTWNVNGLRAVAGKGALNWLTHAAPEVVCLQEIKARPEQVQWEVLCGANPLADYAAAWNPAEKPGYSGVATFTRSSCDATDHGLGVAAFDVEGRVIRSQFGRLHLFNVYFPNGQRGQTRVAYKLDFYAELLRQAQALMAAGEQVVICGDFNTAHREIDLRHPKQNAHTSGFLPEERAWIDRYLEAGLVDAFRTLYPERRDAYTWWTYISQARQKNVGWRLDYFLVSANLMPQVQDVTIHADVMGSDHAPVTLEIADAG
jgi:exodeoxyribonuclease-3